MHFAHLAQALQSQLAQIKQQQVRITDHPLVPDLGAADAPSCCLTDAVVVTLPW